MKLAGNFNGWKEESLIRNKTDIWEIRKYIADGKYLYKFIIDGRWRSDPINVQKEPDNYGDFNSVIYVMNYD